MDAVASHLIVDEVMADSLTPPVGLDGYVAQLEATKDIVAVFAAMRADRVNRSEMAGFWGKNLQTAADMYANALDSDLVACQAVIDVLEHVPQLVWRGELQESAMEYLPDVGDILQNSSPQHALSDIVDKMLGGDANPAHVPLSQHEFDIFWGSFAPFALRAGGNDEETERMKDPGAQPTQQQAGSSLDAIINAAEANVAAGVLPADMQHYINQLRDGGSPAGVSESMNEAQIDPVAIALFWSSQLPKEYQPMSNGNAQPYHRRKTAPELPAASQRNGAASAHTTPHPAPQYAASATFGPDACSPPPRLADHRRPPHRAATLVAGGPGGQGESKLGTSSASLATPPVSSFKSNRARTPTDRSGPLAEARERAHILLRSRHGARSHQSQSVGGAPSNGYSSGPHSSHTNQPQPAAPSHAPMSHGRGDGGTHTATLPTEESDGPGQGIPPQRVGGDVPPRVNTGYMQTPVRRTDQLVKRRLEAPLQVASSDNGSPSFSQGGLGSAQHTPRRQAQLRGKDEDEGDGGETASLGSDEGGSVSMFGHGRGVGASPRVQRAQGVLSDVIRNSAEIPAFRQFSDALRQGRPLHDVLTMVGQDAGDAEAEQETAMKAFVFPHTFLVQEWLEERQPQRATADSDSARGRGRHRQVWPQHVAASSGPPGPARSRSRSSSIHGRRRGTSADRQSMHRGDRNSERSSHPQQPFATPHRPVHASSTPVRDDLVPSRSGEAESPHRTSHIHPPGRQIHAGPASASIQLAQSHETPSAASTATSSKSPQPQHRRAALALACGGEQQLLRLESGEEPSVIARELWAAGRSDAEVQIMLDKCKHHTEAGDEKEATRRGGGQAESATSDSAAPAQRAASFSDMTQHPQAFSAQLARVEKCADAMQLLVELKVLHRWISSASEEVERRVERNEYDEASEGVACDHLRDLTVRVFQSVSERNSGLWTEAVAGVYRDILQALQTP